MEIVDYYEYGYDDEYVDDPEYYEDDFIYSDYSDYDIQLVNYGDDFLSQPVSCLPILLFLVGTFAIILFAFGKIGISLPTVQRAAINPSDPTKQGNTNIAPLFTPEVQYWSSSIAQWSEQTGIEANLIATVMQIESCGDPFAKSNAGALGLFQVMPYHFENGEDPYNPDINARRGIGYLQRALAARDGAIRLGFAGYNGGITGAKRPESQWANETQRYVYWGTGIYNDAVNEQITSERLDEWLSRGGASLCKQAAQRLGIDS